MIAQMVFRHGENFDLGEPPQQARSAVSRRDQAAYVTNTTATMEIGNRRALLAPKSGREIRPVSGRAGRRREIRTPDPLGVNEML
jgi:hypothetical protein